VEIGGILKREHSTIIYEIRSYHALFRHDKNFQEKVIKLQNIMKIEIELNNGRLSALNQCMSPLDNIETESQPRNLKSAVSICKELRDKFLEKAVKTRHNHKNFKMKLQYYRADALWNYLHNFEIYFPDNLGLYEKNACMIIKNELHRQL
jgi:hypothetical protein